MAPVLAKKGSFFFFFEIINTLLLKGEVFVPSGGVGGEGDAALEYWSAKNSYSSPCRPLFSRHCEKRVTGRSWLQR